MLHREGPELRGEDGVKQIEAQAIMALIRGARIVVHTVGVVNPERVNFDFPAVLISLCSFSARRNYNSEN